MLLGASAATNPRRPVLPFLRAPGSRVDGTPKRRRLPGEGLDRFSDLAKEARASTNSYLIGVLERAETREAGRRSGKRWEHKQEEEFQ